MLKRALALRQSVTSYIALAEALGASLVTCDAKLAGSNGHRATIQLIS